MTEKNCAVKCCVCEKKAYIIMPIMGTSRGSGGNKGMTAGVSWDFEGIDDNRNPRKSWVGFSRFKMNFGGERVIYPLSYRQWF